MDDLADLADSEGGFVPSANSTLFRPDFVEDNMLVLTEDDEDEDKLELELEDGLRREWDGDTSCEEDEEDVEEEEDDDL